MPGLIGDKDHYRALNQEPKKRSDCEFSVEHVIGLSACVIGTISVNHHSRCFSSGFSCVSGLWPRQLAGRFLPAFCCVSGRSPRQLAARGRVVGPCRRGPLLPPFAVSVAGGRVHGIDAHGPR